MDDFNSKLYKKTSRVSSKGKKKTKLDWVKVSFCSEFIYKATVSNYRDVGGNVKGDFLNATQKVSATEGMPNSKVNIPATDEIALGSTGHYPGLASMSIPEVVFFGMHSYTKEADKYESFLNESNQLTTYSADPKNWRNSWNCTRKYIRLR
jgi:hypothetical protein